MTKRLGSIVRWVLSVVSLVLLVGVLAHSPWQEWQSLVGHLDSSRIVWGLLLLAAVLPNWLLEALKWKLSLPAPRPTLWESLRQVWIALAWSFLTPGRSGEPIARAQLQAKGRRQAGFLALHNSVAQNLVTLGMGLMGALCLLPQFSSQWAQWSIGLHWAWSIVLAGLLWAGLGALAWRFAPQLRWATLGGMWVFSALRYGVFTLQFYLALAFWGAAWVPQLWAAIGVYYLLNTLMPVLTLAEPGLKVGIAYIVFPWVQLAPSLGAALALSVWLCNVALPVAIGNLWALRLRPIG